MRNDLRRLLAVAALLLLAAATPAPQQGWLGMGFTMHSSDSGRWLFVRRLFSDGPAEAGGLRVYDLITKIDGQPVAFRDDAEAVRYFQRIRPGQTLSFDVRRSNTSLKLKVTARPLPANLASRMKENNEDLAHRKH